MKSFSHHVRKASALIVGAPSRAAAEHQARKAFTGFAKRHKFVYFSKLNAHRDDTHVIRGITLGISAGDSNHIVGTHSGYDIVGVLRQNAVISNRSWVVMQFDLHTAVSLPHIIIGHQSEAKPLLDSLHGIHRDLREHLPSEVATHHAKFAKHYIVYAPPAHAPLVDHIVSTELTAAVVDRLGKIVIEIEGDSVYLCADNPTVNIHYLDKMMHYGIEFAKHIDTRMGAA